MTLVGEFHGGTETPHCSWFDCSLLKKFHKIHIKSSAGAENGRNKLVTFWHRISQPSSLPPSPFHKKIRKKKRKKLNPKVLNQRCFSKLCKIYCLGSTIVVPSLFFFPAVFLTHLQLLGRGVIFCWDTCGLRGLWA